MIYQKQISQQNLTLVIGLGLNHIQKIKILRNIITHKSDMSDMSFYHKPGINLHQHNFASAVSDMDSIMDY